MNNPILYVNCVRIVLIIYDTRKIKNNFCLYFIYFKRKVFLYTNFFIFSIYLNFFKISAAKAPKLTGYEAA